MFSCDTLRGLVPTSTGEKVVPHDRHGVDLTPKVTSFLPIVVTQCFVATNIQLDKAIGHLREKDAFFGRKHRDASINL